jgi:sulfite reductase alpha subunit-like flavoprotein
MRFKAKEFGLNCSVFDLLEYNAKELLSSEKLVVLVISTYGEGDPPDSAIEFNGWIMSSERNSNYLNGVQFAVFGLGNRNYEFFCNMGKVMDRRFEELGAKRIYERGEGDDSAS